MRRFFRVVGLLVVLGSVGVVFGVASAVAFQGPWLAPVDLSATGQDGEEPQVAAAADGTTTAIWRRSDGTDDIVQASTRPAGGVFGAPVDLSATGEDAQEPQVAAAADGTTTAIWSRSDGTERHRAGEHAAGGGRVRRTGRPVGHRRERG